MLSRLAELNPKLSDLFAQLELLFFCHAAIDGKPCQLEYLGYEIQKESVWSYWEITGLKTMKSLQADCNLLYDFVNLQTNIFHVKKGDKEWSRKLDYPDTRVVFSF
jgi:hypothetical protein